MQISRGIKINVVLFRYVQFNEYIGFVKAMDEFRGMKLIRKEGDRNLATNIVVDFDRTKHLSDASVKRRKILRDRFIARDRAKEEEDRKRKKAEEEEKDRERFDFNTNFYFVSSYFFKLMILNSRKRKTSKCILLCLVSNFKSLFCVEL